MVPVAATWQGKGLGSGLLKDAMAQNCLQRPDALPMTQLPFPVLLQSSSIAIPFRIRATYSDAAEFDCIVSHTPAVPGPVC